MSSSSRYCARLPRCRLDWSPRWQVGLLLLGGLLAMLALIDSDLPRALINPALAVTGLLAVWQALRRQRCARLLFEVDRQQGLVWCEGQALEQPAVAWRCGLLVLGWKSDGHTKRCVFLPWQLPEAAVGELRQWRHARRHSTT